MKAVSEDSKGNIGVEPAGVGDRKRVVNRKIIVFSFKDTIQGIKLDLLRKISVSSLIRSIEMNPSSSVHPDNPLQQPDRSAWPSAPTCDGVEPALLLNEIFAICLLLSGNGVC